ncbi:MAG TPA: class I SAM-dependent methyltransferase [Phenylobacterium sp.]|jgi:SAM-dependent methyltransferase|nr:class I SAM-dependent methyltransferase [Phenylobacterium sp.]
MDGFVDQILTDYSSLEPDKADSWNPVGSKFQLGYRLNLFFALARALQHIDDRLEDLRVLDLGCGNGRSARMYLDMGLRPEQVSGLDLRPGAIALARELNPAIRFDLYDGGELPTGHNWLSTTTVFSSVTGRENRQAIADQIAASLPAGGHVFYYDMRRANGFAGGDVIDPKDLFRDFRLVWRQGLGRFSGVPVRDRLRGLLTTRFSGDTLAASLREIAGDTLAPSNEALLLRKA